MHEIRPDRPAVVSYLEQRDALERRWLRGACGTYTSAGEFEECMLMQRVENTRHIGTWPPFGFSTLGPTFTVISTANSTEMVRTKDTRKPKGHNADALKLLGKKMTEVRFVCTKALRKPFCSHTFKSWCPICPQLQSRKAKGFDPGYKVRLSLYSLFDAFRVVRAVV